VIWLNAAAWMAAAAAAAPVVVHWLVHRRAARLLFPTLRFLLPTRLAAVRRRALDDLPLLAIRVSILILAAAAFAGPLLVSGRRRGEWNARLVRETASPSGTRSLAESVDAAVVRLEAAPPARRELVIAAPLVLGSVTAADLAAVPPDVGIRFERTGELPAERTLTERPLATASGPRSIAPTLTGAQTSAAERAGGAPVSLPLDVHASPQAKAVVNAAIAAVLSGRVWTPGTGRRLRLVVADGGRVVTPGDAERIRVPWMADAVAAIARDRDVRDASARIAAGVDRPPPWRVVARAGDGRAAAMAAARGDALAIVSAAPPADLFTPVLVRAAVEAIAPASDWPRAEILPIPDAQLRAWERTPAPIAAPRVDRIDRDDRRWLWAAVLVLLALEQYLRRSRVRDAEETEVARVA